MPLFSRKKSQKDEANPYAQQGQQADPYANAPMTSLQRTQAELGLPVNTRPGRPGLPTGPGPRPGPAAGAPSGPGGPVPQNGPGPQNGPKGPGGPGAPSGYTAGGYGAQGGYGANKYDSGYGNNGSSPYDNRPPSYRTTSDGRPPSYRTTADSVYEGSTGGYGGAAAARGPAPRRGGYGGMGGAQEADDSSRQALFGNAAQKFDEAQGQEGQAGQAGQAGPAGGGGNGSGGGGYGGRPAYDINKGYGAPPADEDRELTTEEQEDEDVKRMNQETRYLRNETDQSLDRSLMMVNQSLETARGTMARLHNQRERILNVESNLDTASNHNKIAEHRAAELKHYNRSMFAVKVNNPFTSKQREAAKAQEAIDEHRAEREQRSETRRLQFQSAQEAEQQFDRFDKTIQHTRQLGQKKGVSSKFTLEDDDEEDVAMEARIDDKMDQLSRGVGGLNMIAKEMNTFVEKDLEHIQRIGIKSDTVDDQVRANRYRLERIEKRG